MPKLTQALFFVNAIVWLLLGIWSLVRVTNDNPGQSTTSRVIAMLMFANAATMLVLLGILVIDRKRYLHA
jgi:hypothetical protein